MSASGPEGTDAENDDPSEGQAESSKHDEKPEGSASSQDKKPPRKQPKRRKKPYEGLGLGEFYERMSRDPSSPLYQAQRNPLENTFTRWIEETERSMPRISKAFTEMPDSAAWVNTLSRLADKQASLGKGFADFARIHPVPEALRSRINDYERRTTELVKEVEELESKTETEGSEVDDELAEQGQELTENFQHLQGESRLLAGLLDAVIKMNRDSTSQWKVSTSVTVIALVVAALAVSSNSAVGAMAGAVSGWPWHVTLPVALPVVLLVWLTVATWNSRGEVREGEGSSCILRVLHKIADSTGWLCDRLAGVLRYARILPRKWAGPDS
ncbi:hypothetical protein ACWFMI_23400 [Nocardiopsis terrae]|uniref:hypothetical protein n=1 Tax=Streptomyces sp. NPDC057554 TaxID=3350538 RepID=UPI0036C9331E